MASQPNSVAPNPPEKRKSGKGLSARMSRGDRSQLFIWFSEIDRVLLGLVLLLIAIGLFAVGAASPASARKLSDSETILDPLYFFWKQLNWSIVGLMVMFLVSLLPRDKARQYAIIGFVVFMALMFATLVPGLGVKVNGARRWVGYMVQIQPSEFLKPLFAVTIAWILSWKIRDPGLPVIALSLAVTMLIGVLLMLQPDLGSTIVFFGMWFVLALLAGLSVYRIAGAMVFGIVGLVLAYFFYPTATHRINGFLFGGTSYDQVDLAYRTMTASGAVGTGPWLGTRKFSLPEAHTDYVYSVIGEEFGLLACGIICLVFLAMIVRVLMRLLEEHDIFIVLAATGLVTQLGGQAIINMAVNLRLFPSKGMTLPFVSYGGSSMIALCMGMGLLLALTRRNPYVGKSPYSSQPQTKLSGRAR